MAESSNLWVNNNKSPLLETFFSFSIFRVLFRFDDFLYTYTYNTIEIAKQKKQSYRNIFIIVIIFHMKNDIHIQTQEERILYRLPIQ